MKKICVFFTIILVTTSFVPALASQDSLNVKTYFKIYNPGEHPQNNYYTCNERTDLDATNMFGDIIKQYDALISLSLTCSAGGRNIIPEKIIIDPGYDPLVFGDFYTGNSDGTPLQIWGKFAYCYDYESPGQEKFFPQQVILQCIEPKLSK